MGEVTRVGIVGAGMMGAEIALCFAMAGNEVTMKDATLKLAQQGKDRLEGVLDKAIQKGRFRDDEKAPTLSLITCTDQYEDLQDVDLIVEAVFVEEDVTTAEDIDTACKLGLGHPIGSYALMDLTSNDLNLKVQEILYWAYGERFRSRPILKQKVNANHLGRKTGRGWYNY